MSEFRDLLERVAERVTSTDDAFAELARRRARKHRNRRIQAGALAFAIAALGTIGAYAAFRHTEAPKPATEDRARPFIALWPEQDLESAREAQAKVDAGADRWRLNPHEVAVRFADSVLGWRGFPLDTGPIGRGCDEYPEYCLTGPNTASAYVFRLGGVSDWPRVKMARLVRKGAGGIWSVTRVDTTRLRLALRPGTVIHPGQAIEATTDLPNGTRVVAGVAWGWCDAPNVSHSVPARVIDGSVVAHMPHFHARADCPSVKQGGGWVFFLTGSPRDVIDILGLGLFQTPRSQGPPDIRSARVSDIAVVPVRISASPKQA